MKTPQKLTIVEFMVFNQNNTMILEDVDAENVESVIRKKTFETAVVFSYTEYSGITEKKHFKFKQSEALTIPDGYYDKHYKKLEQDSLKKKNQNL